MRDRTADLLRAKQALSQLSYSPIVVKSRIPVIFPETRRQMAKHTISMRVILQRSIQGKFGRPEWT